MKKIILATAVVVTLLCSNTVNAKPTNVIYLIGDGMGFGAVSSLLLAEDAVTGFEQAPRYPFLVRVPVASAVPPAGESVT